MNLWNYKATVYDYCRRLFPFNHLISREIENLKELFLKLDLNNIKILDVGTGTGAVLDYFPENAKVFALDSSTKMIDKARHKGIKNFVVADSLALPFKPGSIDLVTAIGLFEYQKSQIRFLKELRQVVTPCGYLLVTYAQLNILNFMRWFLGHKLYFVNSNKFINLLGECGFTCKIVKKSLIQRQVLLK